MTKTSETNQSIITELSKPVTKYDFIFTLKPFNILKKAFQSLGDQSLNPCQDGLIEVDQFGCQFMVWNIDDTSWNQSNGYFALKANGLQRFQCRFKLKGIFSFIGLEKLFRAAEKFGAESVTIFVVERSNRLSFQWGNTANDFGLGLPMTIPLRVSEAALSGFIQFPNVSYGFEVVLPTPVMKTLFEKVRNKTSKENPEKILVNLQTASMKVGVGVDEQDEGKEEEYMVGVNWGHWEALECASETADKCSVYLVTKPAVYLMIRFHLEELGDLVFLSEAELDRGSDRIPVLGHFPRLNSW